MKRKLSKEKAVQTSKELLVLCLYYLYNVSLVGTSQFVKRMEKENTSLQLDAILKVLASLRKTFKIVSIKTVRNSL